MTFETNEPIANVLSWLRRKASSDVHLQKDMQIFFWQESAGKFSYTVYAWHITYIWLVLW